MTPTRKYIRRRGLQGMYCECPRGFTLVELLIVVGIIVAMMALMGPAMNSLKSARDVIGVTYDISGQIQEARAYALANHTYVYVGFFEEDGSKESTIPATKGVGRVVVATVASKDGTRGYFLTSGLSDPAWNNSASQYNNGNNLIPVGTLRKFDHVHLSDKMNGSGGAGGALPPTTGKMARTALESKYVIGSSAMETSTVTPFEWPLGKALGTGQYTFRMVVNFDPLGTARIQTADNEDSIGQFAELALQQVQANVAPPAPEDQNIGQQTAIVIDCMSGSAKIYKP